MSSTGFIYVRSLSFDLASPDDGSYYWGQVAHLGHVVGFGEEVLCCELVVLWVDGWKWMGKREEKGTLSYKCLRSSFTESIS